MNEKESEKATRIWNRALSNYAGRLLAGDWALSEMLRLHGYIMNGGVLHGVAAMESEDWEFMIVAYRLFGLGEVADFLVDTERAFRTGDDHGALETRANTRYCADLIPDERRLFDAFRIYLRAHPEMFAP
jgi:hypothetical protein